MLDLSLSTSLEWVSAPPLPPIRLPPCVSLHTADSEQMPRFQIIHNSGTICQQQENAGPSIKKKKKITLKPTPGSRSCQSNEEVKKRREGRSCFHPKGFCQAWQMWMSILITCEGREMKIKVQGDLPHNYDPMGLPSGLSWARNQAALARTSARSAWGAGGSSSLNFRLAVPESSVPTKKAERKAPLLERRTSHQSCKLLL